MRLELSSEFFDKPTKSSRMLLKMLEARQKLFLSALRETIMEKRYSRSHGARRRWNRIGKTTCKTQHSSARSLACMQTQPHCPNLGLTVNHADALKMLPRCLLDAFRYGWMLERCPWDASQILPGCLSDASGMPLGCFSHLGCLSDASWMLFNFPSKIGSGLQPHDQHSTCRSAPLC